MPNYNLNNSDERTAEVPSLSSQAVGKPFKFWRGQMERPQRKSINAKVQYKLYHGMDARIAICNRVMPPQSVSIASERFSQSRDTNVPPLPIHKTELFKFHYLFKTNFVEMACKREKQIECHTWRCKAYCWDVYAIDTGGTAWMAKKGFSYYIMLCMGMDGYNIMCGAGVCVGRAFIKAFKVNYAI